MHVYPSEQTRQAVSNFVSFADLSDLCGMSDKELDELMEYGALESVDTPGSVLKFNADCVAPLRTAGKLRKDYDLDFFMVVILMDFLKRIASLEEQLDHFRRLTAAHAMNEVLN